MKKILIVEDNDDVRETIGLSLKTDYECRTAANGRDALAIISDGFVPDLILTDVIMPVLNGIGLAHQLQFQKIQIPIVFMSGDLGSHNLKELHQFSSHLLMKPFRFKEDLEPVIKVVLGLPFEVVREV